MDDSFKKSKFIIIAGELSGDHHGAKLISALKSIQPAIEVSGIGGDLMIQEGLKALYHIKQLSFLGFGEIVRHLPFIYQVYHSILIQIKNTKPDAVILIDYPGFNLRLARAVKKLGIPVIYYISPQLWAWGRGRVKKIKRFVDCMLVVFPFEIDFYRQFGIEAEYVGHPIVDRYYHSVKPKRIGLNDDKILGILPGSRIQEIEKLLPDMVSSALILYKAKKIKKAIIARVNHIPLSIYTRYIKDNFWIEIYQGEMEHFYNQLDAALVASGTATLEVGYFQIPMVIVYRVNFLTWLFARLIIKLDRIGLANIVAKKEIAVELIQNNFKPVKAARLIENLLDNKRNEEIRKEMHIIRENLGLPGASIRAAQVILNKKGTA
jgi:lipid-A-disaccharide synthase